MSAVSVAGSYACIRAYFHLERRLRAYILSTHLPCSIAASVDAPHGQYLPRFSAISSYILSTYKPTTCWSESPPPFFRSFRCCFQTPSYPGSDGPGLLLFSLSTISFAAVFRRPVTQDLMVRVFFCSRFSSFFRCCFLFFSLQRDWLRRCCQQGLYGWFVDRNVRVPAGAFLPRAPPARLHPVDVPAEHARRPAVLGLVLDRLGVGAGSHLARHTHHADHHHPELRPGPLPRRLFHQGPCIR